MAPLPISGLPGISGITPLDVAAPTGLTDKLQSAADLQSQADTATQAVASGKSDDLVGATLAVEKASIATELVGAIRNKALDAYHEVMRMQV
jgi:flagellar hook-basal body complex protein FliE